MNTLTSLYIILAINLVAMIYTIVRTKNSNFHPDTKTLLYVMAVVTPLIGFLLFLIKNRQIRNYSTQ